MSLKKGFDMKELEELRKSNVEKVPGKNNNHIVQIITISTCIWCKRMKSLLNENEIKEFNNSNPEVNITFMSNSVVLLIKIEENE